MTQLTKLKSANEIKDVAALLGFKASTLSFILYKKGSASKYESFEIPKRYGGTRQICAPLPELKLLQRRLSDLLQNCLQEINEANGQKNQQLSHGFMRKRTIITNAKKHRNRKYVFNVDLSDFFGSINFGRVRGFFMKDKNFSLHANVATVLAQIACFENALPQGSPCSPVVSNLIGHILDIHLVRLASQNGCTYSRYADDLTFSTNKLEFPACIAKRTDNEDNRWVPGIELVRLVESQGFLVNPLKTRMQYRDSRQEVTGLVVNRKVNIRSEYRHTVRAMVHRLLTKGYFEFVHTVNDEKETVTINKIQGNMSQLHGMLGFIDNIDLYNKNITQKTKGKKDQPNLSSKESIYRRFLLFKEFYVAPAPVIICEGKTDNVYILHAIRSLAETYPQLATKNSDGSIKLKARIYKYSNTATGRILGINGGTPDLSKFINLYSREIKKFKAPGAQHPIILLVDNDDGKKPIFSAIKEIIKKQVGAAEQFVHIISNFYLVATPLNGKDKSRIEDFFDDVIKSKIVDGKSFDPESDIDTETHYGKIVFAHKVVKAHADKIDFSGFNSILSNIVSVIDAHAKKHPIANPAS